VFPLISAFPKKRAFKPACRIQPVFLKQLAAVILPLTVSFDEKLMVPPLYTLPLMLTLLFAWMNE